MSLNEDLPWTRVKILKILPPSTTTTVPNIVRLLKLLLLGAKRNVLVRLLSLDFKRVSFLFSLSVSLQPESREKILSFRSCVEKSFNNLCLSIEIHWIRSSASHRPIDYYFPRWIPLQISGVEQNGGWKQSRRSSIERVGQQIRKSCSSNTS